MKVVKSMIFGMAIGTIVGMAMFPELDRKTQKNIRKAKRKAACMASDTYDNIICYMK